MTMRYAVIKLGFIILIEPRVAFRQPQLLLAFNNSSLYPFLLGLAGSSCGSIDLTCRITCIVCHKLDVNGSEFGGAVQAVPTVSDLQTFSAFPDSAKDVGTSCKEYKTSLSRFAKSIRWA
jgi:hypothetical protein